MKKTCTKCHQEKALDDFNKQAAGKHGRDSQCRDCAKARQAKWRQENPDKIRAGKKKWKDENPDRVVEYQRQWRMDNADLIAEYRQKYYEENRERYIESTRKFSQAKKAETGASATNKGKPWTDEERALLLREDISITEMSKMLGRTYASVAMQRSLQVEHHKRLAMIDEVQRRLAG